MNAADTGQSDSASMAQTIYIEDSRVACDGGGGALGHPQVYSFKETRSYRRRKRWL